MVGSTRDVRERCLVTDMTPAYYDVQSDTYDDSRGGVERARVAATAITELVAGTGRCLDIAGGTGIVTHQLAERGWSVAVLDASIGMLRQASVRLPGRAVQASADRLPVADDAVDLVTIIWMLNLVPTEVADTMLIEAARVLAPRGSLVMTVDKEKAHSRTAQVASDSDERVSEFLRGHQMTRTGGATFRSPSPWDRPPTRTRFSSCPRSVSPDPRRSMSRIDERLRLPR